MKKTFYNDNIELLTFWIVPNYYINYLPKFSIVNSNIPKLMIQIYPLRKDKRTDPIRLAIKKRKNLSIYIRFLRIKLPCHFMELNTIWRDISWYAFNFAYRYICVSYSQKFSNRKLENILLKWWMEIQWIETLCDIEIICGKIRVGCFPYFTFRPLNLPPLSFIIIKIKGIYYFKPFWCLFLVRLEESSPG